MVEESLQCMNQSGVGSGCPHSGYYSGLGVYSRESGTLRYVLVCDACGEEMQEIAALGYVPAPVFAT